MGQWRGRTGVRLRTALAAALMLGAGGVRAQQPSLTLASMNDPFAVQLQRLAKPFTEQTGIALKVDILSYPELASKVTADFVGRTRTYDLVTMDIVWAGQYAESGFTMDLTDWVARDGGAMKLDDVYPAVLKGLGNYKGRQVAFPFAAYANVLAYRTDLYEKAGLTPPATMEELVADAAKLTNPSANVYGWAANGRKGSPVAQDWMQYNAQIGGSILGPDGKPALNSQANVRSLAVYRDLFRTSSPPGAVNYDWAARHEAFRQGLVATHQSWTISLASYENPDISKIVGKTGIVLAPVAAGMDKVYGMGGWALAINDAVDPARKAAAWTFIKWVTSPEVQKLFLDNGVGVFIRKSTVTDPALVARYPFLKVVDQALSKGDADFRPRIPQYPQIQEILGNAVNAVVVGSADPKAALDDAQARAARLF